MILPLLEERVGVRSSPEELCPAPASPNNFILELTSRLAASSLGGIYDRSIAG
jgi:hypothetical protein